MRRSQLSAWVIAVILMVGFLTIGMVSAFGEQVDNRNTKDSPKFMAYYFYTTIRCRTCVRIEQWSREAIETTFKNEIEHGELQWQAINIDEPENKHFIQDYKLYTKSVILVELKNGNPVRWDNLEDVWRLSGDRDKFLNYVSDGTRIFMEKS